MLIIGKLYRIERTASLYDVIYKQDISINSYKHIGIVEKDTLCVILELNESKEWHTKNYIAKVLTSKGVTGWIILSCANPALVLV
jgi:hypothetical protein